MARAYLRANAELTIAKEPYIVERQCTDGVWVLKHARTGRQLERTTEQIFDGHARGEVVFVAPNLRTINSGRLRRAQSAHSVSANELAAARIRMAYVRAVVGLSRSRKAIESAIERVWQSLEPRPETKPGWVAVYRWTRAYVASGEIPEALIVSHAAKGNRKPRFSPDVVALCQDVIENVYLTQERPSLQHAVNIAMAKVRRENELRTETEKMAMPSRRLLQRLIDQRPAYDTHAARYGREAARKMFRTSAKCRLTDSPLQRAEMDHTRMDMFVVDDEYGLPLGRPWLTVLVDDYTRCVLGLNISFEPPSRATVAKCLKHAFMPKTGLRDKYPALRNDWVPFGVPSELVLDGGAEFYSEELEQICFELNIEQHFSPRKTPWFKGKVERFQGTLNRGVSVATPGKTFEGIVDRDDYDPKLHALVTLSGLREIVVRWVVDIYHQKTHSALGCSPVQMWANTVRPHDIAVVDDPLRFDAILGRSEERVLSHKGIEYAGLVYNSAELGEIRQHLGERLAVQIRIDRSNLESIIVLHPERGTPYRVPCLRFDYAEGLTEWQHEVCKRYSREQNKVTAGDIDAWLDALLDIAELVERELNLGRRKGTTRERIARWQGSTPAAVGQASANRKNRPGAPASTQAVPPVLPCAPQSTVSPAADQPDTSMPGIAPVERRRFKPIFEDRINPSTPDDSRPEA